MLMEMERKQVRTVHVHGNWESTESQEGNAGLSSTRTGIWLLHLGMNCEIQMGRKPQEHLDFMLESLGREPTLPCWFSRQQNLSLIKQMLQWGSYWACGCGAHKQLSNSPFLLMRHTHSIELVLDVKTENKNALPGVWTRIEFYMHWKAFCWNPT